MTDDKTLGNIFTNMLIELEKDLPEESTARHLLYSHRVKIREAFDAAASAVRRAVIDECIQSIRSHPAAIGESRWDEGVNEARIEHITALRSLKGETDDAN